MTDTPTWIDPPDPGQPDPIVTYHGDGITVAYVIYHNTQGQRHRDNGPGFMSWDTDGTRRAEIWYQHGKAERTEGPAITTWDSQGMDNKDSINLLQFLNYANMTIDL